jgi:transposase
MRRQSCVFACAHYQQLDALVYLHRQARKELLAEGRKHKATKLLRQIPSIGSIRSVLLVALLQTPHRFPTKRQLWTYSGLALETRNTGEYPIEGGQLKRSKKVFAIRGLNKNHNHDRKNKEAMWTGNGCCSTGPYAMKCGVHGSWR